MQSFQSDNVEIAYLDQAPDQAAPQKRRFPCLLIHGFASNTQVNWINTGWLSTLAGAGFRAIGIDNRGHGESEKRYDTAAYGSPLMAEDARRLLDHLGIEKAHVIGYSMGARISAFLAQAHPERIASVTFGGLGYNMIRGMAGTGAIANALEAASIDDITNSTARTFRAFAEQTGSDLRALAACIRSSRAPITADALGAMQRPALVVVGSEDVIGGSAAKLAEVMPQADAVTLEGKDHMKAVGDAEFKAATLDFMARHDG